VNVAPAEPPSLTNTATVSGGGELNTANNTASNITTIGPGSDLTISKSHSGSFRQGQTGAIYTITVSNSGSAPSSGAVLFGDSVPAGLTPTAAAGAGWTCNITGQNVDCTRNDALNAGASYPAITLMVNVAPAAPPSLTNTAAVLNFVDVNLNNNSATDVATILPGADLTIAKSHTGNFTQGQTATYTVTVTNVGVGPASGTVVVADPMPLPLTPSTASGSGWSCAVLTNLIECQRSDALGPGASYPPITMSARIASNAAPILNTATVNGGGDGNASNNSASDTAAVTPAPDLMITKRHTGPSSGTAGNLHVDGEQCGRLALAAGPGHDIYLQACFPPRRAWVDLQHRSRRELQPQRPRTERAGDHADSERLTPLRRL
jgi:uncharacterized repeat protein (TIGR01451 family)